MSAFYGLYGELRVRKCPKVDEIIETLNTCSILELEVSESEPGIVTLALEGCGLLSHAAGIELEELVKSLGPYTLEPAILVSDFEHSEDVLIVAATEDLEKATLSRHRLEQISQMMRDLSLGDRAQLAAMVANGAS